MNDKKNLIAPFLLDLKIAGKRSESFRQGIDGLLECVTPAQVAELPSRQEARAVVSRLENQIEEWLSGAVKSFVQEAHRLLSLNPSRREAILEHLECLTAQFEGLASVEESFDLTEWLSAVSPGSTRLRALEAFGRETIALALGQAILLKRWEELGVRALEREDLGRLNWTFSSALRPFIPFDREGWVFLRPNLYSWYVLREGFQEALFHLLKAHTFKVIPSEKFAALILSLRLQSTASKYHADFLGSLIRFSLHHKQGMPIRSVFTPSLGEGLLRRLGPQDWQWGGLEMDAYRLAAAELSELWNGPVAPPLWTLGTGLEVRAPDQLTLQFHGGKQATAVLLRGMQTFDLGFLCENETLRVQGKGVRELAIRDHLEDLPAFKKLKAPGTSLGILQAISGLSKLRPRGWFLWAREEPLHSREGSESLRHLLSQARLLAEWDLSEVEHQLPGNTKPFAKFLYLFERDTDFEHRFAHRPLRYTVSGQIRSYVELPLFYQDMLAAFEPQLNVLEVAKTPSRGPWEIVPWCSPTTQKEWAEQWPDVSTKGIEANLQKLRGSSKPLAAIATLLEVTDGKQRAQDGVYLSAATHSKERSLEVSRDIQHFTHAKVFLLVAHPETRLAALEHYLTSQEVFQWLERFAERRSGRWILNEQILKCVPVPMQLVRAMEKPEKLPESFVAAVSQFLIEPAALTRAVETLDAALYPEAYIELVQLKMCLQKTVGSLAHLTDEEGRIHWRSLLSLVPRTAMIAINKHPQVVVTGHVPFAVPLVKMTKVRSPTQGYLLQAEQGLSLHIHIRQPLLAQMFEQLMEDFNGWSWSELAQECLLPLDLGSIEETAREVLLAFEKERHRKETLLACLKRCKLI